MKVVTFLSDFGNNSGYIAQMKGVILSKYPDVKLIDISHGINPQQIQTGAFVLESTASFFPKGTIHIAVIDPGVGTDRRGIVVVTSSAVFIGPDNGLLIPAARKQGSFVVYEIANKEYVSDAISSTFHGRDVFAKVASYILTGISFDSIGPKIHDYTILEMKKPVLSDTLITGEVLYIDDFGNIITSIDKSFAQNHFELGKMYTLIVNKKEYQIPYHQSYGFIPRNQMLLTMGSSNHIEIAINQGNAADRLKVHFHDEVKVKLS